MLHLSCTFRVLVSKNMPDGSKTSEQFGSRSMFELFVNLWVFFGGFFLVQFIQLVLLLLIEGVVQMEVLELTYTGILVSFLVVSH